MTTELDDCNEPDALFITSNLDTRVCTITYEYILPLTVVFENKKVKMVSLRGVMTVNLGVQFEDLHITLCVGRKTF